MPPHVARALVSASRGYASDHAFAAAAAKAPYVAAIAQREGRLADRTCPEGAGRLSALASLIDYLSLPALLLGTTRLPSRAAGENLALLPEGSHTAESTTSARMLGHALGFGPDHLAAALAKPEHFYSAFEPSVTRARWQYSITGRLPGHSLVSHYELDSAKRYCALTAVQVRTCFMDDVAERFVEQHPASNVVLLGAGLDSRFFRLASLGAAEVRRYEVDGPGSQQQKISRMHAAGVDTSAVTFVPCDFEAESWLELLVAAGLDRELPTLLLWEGVCMYISQKAVESTLATVATGFAAESAIAFDYITPDHIALYSELLIRLGEALHFGADSDAMASLAIAAGLGVVDQADTHELLDLYMPPGVGLTISSQKLMLLGNACFMRSSAH